MQTNTRALERYPKSQFRKKTNQPKAEKPDPGPSSDEHNRDLPKGRRIHQPSDFQFLKENTED